MTVVSTDQNREARTFTIVTEFGAPPSAVWDLWTDPRRLERWWGPPSWPATFVKHDVAVGAGSHYYMTGPEGEQAHGWWRFISLDEPRSLEFEDGFADETGAPNDDLPRTTVRVHLAEIANGTRMTITSHFASVEQLDQMVAMGMVEGMTEALGQIDELLAAV